jgi:hypothetical protein
MKFELFDVISGVIRGAKLSPVLFNIYIREIISVILYSKPFKYADDNDNDDNELIYDISDTLLLQTDLDAVHKWSAQKRLKLNASKSVHMRFSLKKISSTSFVSNQWPVYTFTTKS